MKHEVVHDRTEWKDLLTTLPGGHLLQSWEWGHLKELYGWQAHRIAWREQGTPHAAAQILRRAIVIPGLRDRLSILYCPRGPALDWSDETLRKRVLSELCQYAQRQGAIFLKIDPDLAIGFGLPNEPDAEEDPLGQEVLEELRETGWRSSIDQVQFRNTLLLDLTKPEDELLSAMKQKTRYNIRLAGRRGVTVRHGNLEDIGLLFHMYAETSVRDNFPIRNPAYYQDAWGEFIRLGMAQPLIAEVGSKPIAALIVYRFKDTATYMYGMSRSIHRDKMPNHLLQWEAIRWAQQVGCLTYDFWGAPDHLTPEDPMWGVYRFKLGYGARLVRTLGAWDYTSKRFQYWLYTFIMPRFLSLLRLKGRAETRRELGV